MGEQLYSYHVFYFPFQWDYLSEGLRQEPLEKRTELKHLVRKLDRSSNWCRSAFELNTKLNYNEYNYFYEFVRESLYDQKKENDDNPFIAHYYYKREKDEGKLSQDLPSYRISTMVSTENGRILKNYELQIDSIVLHVYSTGIGVLSFHLNNRKKDQSGPDDILRINQFGRRIYPPFLGVAKEDIGTARQFAPGGFDAGLELVKCNELAHCISIVFDSETTIEEDFCQYVKDGWIPQDPFMLPKCFKVLLKDILPTESADADPYRVKVKPLLDDRMFVLCWYGNDHLVNIKKSDRSGSPLYLKDPWWYKFVMVDSNLMTMQNSKRQAEVMEEHTNARWLNYGTLYGASRYSFVCLTASLEKLKKVDAAFLVNHMETMYYKMVELCLVQRACLLRFSDEVHDISLMKDTNTKKLSNKVQSLYKQYIRFVNRIYFREVTAQEQGIELYDLVQRQMKLERDVKDLDGEIEELYQYVMMAEEQERAAKVNLLTNIGAVFLGPTLIAGFYGMNMFGSDTWVSPPWYWVLSIMILFPVLAIVLLGNGTRFSWKRIWMLIVLVVIAIIVLTLFSESSVCEIQNLQQ